MFVVLRVPCRECFRLLQSSWHDKPPNPEVWLQLPEWPATMHPSEWQYVQVQGNGCTHNRLNQNWVNLWVVAEEHPTQTNQPKTKLWHTKLRLHFCFSQGAAANRHSPCSKTTRHITTHQLFSDKAHRNSPTVQWQGTSQLTSCSSSTSLTGSLLNCRRLPSRCSWPGGSLGWSCPGGSLGRSCARGSLGWLRRMKHAAALAAREAGGASTSDTTVSTSMSSAWQTFVSEGVVSLQWLNNYSFSNVCVCVCASRCACTVCKCAYVHVSACVCVVGVVGQFLSTQGVLVVVDL